VSRIRQNPQETCVLVMGELALLSLDAAHARLGGGPLRADGDSAAVLGLPEARKDRKLGLSWQPSGGCRLKDIAQAGVGRGAAQRQTERLIQALAMNANEFLHLTVRIGSRHHARDRIQQHRRQIEPLALGAPTIRDRLQNLQPRRRHPTTAIRVVAHRFRHLRPWGSLADPQSIEN